MRFETGNYIDRTGREWFCVAETKSQRMVCNRTGVFTVANFKTFEVWRWTPKIIEPASEILIATDGGGK